MNILIFGNGMYVAGRGTKEFGTVVPSIVEFQRSTNLIDNVIVCGRTRSNLKATKTKINIILKKSGIKINFFYKIIPKNKFDKTLKKIKKELSVDASIIVVPDNLHYPIAKSCLRNKLHTMVVKPAATKVKHIKDVRKLDKKSINLSKKKNNSYMYMYRALIDKSKDYLNIRVDNH